MAEIETGQNVPSVIRTGAGTTIASKAPVVAYQRLRRSGVVDADGRIVLNFGTVPSGVEWFIERISITCDSTVQTAFDMYVDMESDLYRLEHSPIGNDNIADYACPIWIPSSTLLLAVWSNVTAIGANGAQAVAQISAQVRTVS